MQEILDKLNYLEGQFEALSSKIHNPQEESEIDLAEVEYDALAGIEIHQRKLRLKFFPSKLFGEAGWNILLDLYVQERANQRVSVTSACIASGAPESTGLRYVEYLEDVGLIVRENDPKDLRRIYLSLTDECRKKIHEFLSESNRIQMTFKGIRRIKQSPFLPNN